MTKNDSKPRWVCNACKQSCYSDLKVMPTACILKKVDIRTKWHKNK